MLVCGNNIRDLPCLEAATLIEADGVPAACFFQNDLTYPRDVLFVRAADAAGTGWLAPQILGAGSQYCLPSMAVFMAEVCGHPTIASHLAYLTRALDAQGTAWSPTRVLGIGLNATVIGVKGKVGYFYSDSDTGPHCRLCYCYGL